MAKKQIGFTGYVVAGKAEAQSFAFPIIITEENDLYFVTYGKQTTECATYSAACREIGKSIMHALCCDGAFDNA